jgi:hypothetical protein
VIFPDNIYQITVDDYDGKPYTFEVSGEAIAQEFRREVLLTKQWTEIYNEIKNGDGNEKQD